MPSVNENVVTLINLIEKPELSKDHSLSDVQFRQLLFLAESNKIPLLFLESVINAYKNNIQIFTKRYLHRHQQAMNLIHLLSRLFDEKNIPYAIFKTLKPFPYVPADIDVLLYAQDDLRAILNLMIGKGFKFLGRDAYNVNMFNQSYLFGIDLYLQPAVSNLVYINGRELLNYTRWLDIGENKVCTLMPHAEIIAAASHSLYKEFLYTLADFYTIRNFLEVIEPEDLLLLARRAKCEVALSVVLTLTVIVSKLAGVKEPRSARDVVSELGRDWTSQNLLETSDAKFDLPYRFPIKFIAPTLMDKLKHDALFRSTLPRAFKKGTSLRQMKKMIAHFRRTTY